MDQQNVLIEKTDQIAIITLNRPDQLNPLDKATVAEMRSAIADCEDDADVRALVITGRGRAFSAGGDLKGYMSLYRDPVAFERFLHDFGAMCFALEDSAKPVVAAVNGFCVAGGLELMLACDVVFASEDAKIGDGHLNFGQLPGAGGSQRLLRVVGSFRAKELLFSGDLLPASEAMRIGLVNRVLPASELLPSAIAFCKKTIGHSPLAVKGAKYLVNRGGQTDISAALELEMRYVHHYATTSHDASEGLLAFSEKRSPRFKGL